MLKDYLEKNNIEVKPENEYHYISFDTEFENISIKYDDEVLSDSEYDLLRFVKPFINKAFKCEELTALHFLPTEVEKQIKLVSKRKCIPNEEYNSYLPESFRISKPVKSTSIQFIKHANREKYGTSFFQYYNIDDIMEVVKELKESLPSLKKCKIAKGYLPTDLGILEKKRHLKTEEPDSRHISFWKFKETDSFDVIPIYFEEVV